MKKIDLSIYKEFKQYFLFYDVVIKGQKSNKEEWLKANSFSPSSYRRAKEDGNKIGIEIIKELNKKFSYNMISDEIIDEIENKINEIYYNIYYKKVESYEENMNWIEKKIQEKYIINPVLLLFKLLLIVNSKIDPKKTILEYQSLFTEINKYKEFYNNDLLEVFEIINISFINDIDLNVLSYDYKNELSYFTLSTKCILKGMYIEAIYFAEKSKQIFIKEENAKRIYYINLNLMSAYNYLGKYNECYLLAQKQMIALESYKCDEFEYLSAKKHYLISCFGLGKYKDVIKVLEKKVGLNKTDYCCLLISKYKDNKNEYTDFYTNLISLEMCSESNVLFFKLINKFIIKKDKRLIEEIAKHQITKSVVEILKKM